MSATCQAGGEEGFAKRRTAIHPPKKLKKNIALLALKTAIQRLYPQKTADHLSALTGLSRRGAQLTLAETTRPNGDTFANAVRSECGFEVLRELMRPDYGPVPDWWADFERGFRLVELERQAAAVEAQQRQLRRQLDVPDL